MSEFTASWKKYILYITLKKFGENEQIHQLIAR